MFLRTSLKLVLVRSVHHLVPEIVGVAEVQLIETCEFFSLPVADARKRRKVIPQPRFIR